MNNNLWIDTRLTEEEMNFLNDAISEENIKNWISTIAHNIHKTELIVDKDNWFFKSVIKKLTERMFYRNWDNYYKYHIEKEEPPPEFEMHSFWVNYMKQHEFNPLHNHVALYSFVIFMKIPTHWKEQHALPIFANSGEPLASNFSFVWSLPGTNEISKETFPLSPEDEGRILFFPASLYHLVYPFYECEEGRITISGDIRMYDSNKLVYDSNKPKMQEVSGDVYEEKENMLKMMENGIEFVKEELKQMKKEREKEELESGK